LGQELNGGHPFVSGKSGFPGQVVHVGNHPFQDVLQSQIAALGVDSMHILCDVIDREILQSDGRGHGVSFFIELFG
jgi:hypothetical protein